MKKKFDRQKLSISFLLIILALSSNSFAPAQTTNQQRDRVAPQQTPTPRQTPTPSPSRSLPVPAPTISPTPSVSPTPAIRIQTLPELHGNIRAVLQRGALQRGQVGVKIVSLDSGKTIYEENAEKYFMPASNMKSFTVAAALARLTPNFRFVTSVYAPSQPDANGTIQGDVIIYGRGDPSFAASFNDGDYYKGLNNLVEKIASSGVKRIEGNLVGDESYFSGEPLGSSWEWDDLQWYYGAEVSALSINDNAVDLQIRPGAQVGQPLSVAVLPANSLISIVNLTQTAPAGTKRTLEVKKRLGTNVLEIRGTMPLRDEEFKGSIAVSKPAELFVAMLKNALQQKGITVAGQTRTIDAKARQNLPLMTTNLAEIARLESPLFSLIAAKTMKPSQNLYTELILRTLGEAAGDKTDPNRTSAERGLEVVQKFLLEAGVASDAVVQFDGSGLSRHNLITPSAAVGLYSYMSRHPFAMSWSESLTIGGVDGTLKNRFRGTSAVNNVRGKTGTINQVGTLSGYVTTAGGERLAFSILTNNLPDSTLRRQTMDDIVLLLANFNGKLN